MAVGSWAATSTASLIASPSEPGESGSLASIARPASVRSEGLGCTVPPNVSIMILRYGLASYDARTCQTSHSRSNCAQANASAVPHWPGAGLGGQLPDAGPGVVVGLRHRGVRLVRAGGRDALVLVVDAGRGAERLLEPVGPVQRGGPPQPVDVLHLLRDVDVLLGAHLLRDEVHREDRGEVVRADRLPGARVQRRRGRSRQVVEDVVPARRHLVLVEQDLVAQRC